MCTVLCFGGCGCHGSRRLVNTACWQPCVGGDQAHDPQRGGWRSLITFWVKVELASCWGPQCLTEQANGSGKVSYFPLELGSKNQLGCLPSVAVTGQGQAVGL